MYVSISFSDTFCDPLCFYFGIRLGINSGVGYYTASFLFGIKLVNFGIQVFTQNSKISHTKMYWMGNHSQAKCFASKRPL